MASHTPTLVTLLIATFCLAAGTPCIAEATAVNAGPQVKTIDGELRGVNENGIEVFRGVPFAADVGGAGRWRPPAPPAHWSGVRDATVAGPICPQSTKTYNGVPPPWMALFRISEDCLNLSVFTPSLKADAKAPVMVWIHGGGARAGSGSQFDGAELAKRGVVVVTINYRLDRLGLFAHPALTASQPREALGNYGLMDIVASLRWVKANIKVFGGDPHNVTIFGQSSGAVAVTALMVSPLAKGLYQKAIAQSGSIAVAGSTRYLSSAMSPVNSLESDGVAMAKALHVDTSKNIPAQLRALPWQAIIDYTDTQPPSVMVPVVDGKVIPRDPVRMFADGQQNSTPFMGGSVSWEQSLIAPFNLPLGAALQGVSPDAVRSVYGKVDDKTLAGEWFADSFFHAPARFAATEMERHGQPAYVYQFAHLGASTRGKQPGAAHSDEIPYLLGRLGVTQAPAPDQADLELADTMKGYWIHFARSGNPNGAGLPIWPQYTAADHALMVLDTAPTVSHKLLQARMEFMAQRYQQSLAQPAPTAKASH